MIKEDDYKSRWGPGEKANGTIPLMTEEEARQAIIQRNAEEKAFGEIIGEHFLPDKPTSANETESERLHEFGIGQRADGSINCFPVSEWPKRRAEYELWQAAFEAELRNVFGPQPDGASDPDDLSDLDDDYSDFT